MRWVIKAWDEGLVECQSDLDNLENENSTLKGMKAILEEDDTKPTGGTAGTPRGPPPGLAKVQAPTRRRNTTNYHLINTRISGMQVKALSKRAESGWDQQEGENSEKGAS